MSPATNSRMDPGPFADTTRCEVTHYEREVTHGRATLRFSVWTDSAGDVTARLVLEPSEGRLHPLSMDLTPAILDGIAAMADECADAFEDAVLARTENAA